MYTIEQVKEIVPKKKHNRVTQDFVDMLNSSLCSEEHIEEFKENFVSFSRILKGEVDYKLPDYINAVKFVTLRALGHTVFDSWKITFPHRHERLVKLGKTTEELRPYASNYNNNELVKKLYAQAQVGTHVLNAPMFQEALNIAMDIARDEDASAIARVQATRTILEYTKAPEVQDIQISIAHKETDELQELKKTMRDFALLQGNVLEQGKSTLKEIAESKIIDVEVDNEQ